MKKNNYMKPLLLAALALALLVPVAVVTTQLAFDPGSDQPAPPVVNTAEQIERGAYLARAGNCMGCHSARGGQSYAGGRAIPTPFGSIYASNITPDTETGIGSWTSQDFWRAIHNGKSKDGHFLYPAFPYPNYTKLSRADADALFAFFKTVPPVRLENKEQKLRFPYNQRMLLAFWRTLYFTPGEFATEAKQSPQWNRGAYLVQGLGHCAACHTARNALGGTLTGADLAGGMIPMLDWYASSLTPDAENGLGTWEAKDIADLLKSGISERGAVFGPMAEVVKGSLQHLSQSDIDAMVTYLKTGNGKSNSGYVKQAAAPSAAQEATLKQGAKLYEQHCAACHQADGKGIPPAYPSLAGKAPVAHHSALNPPGNQIRIVLNGGYPPSTAGNPRPYGMPAFSPMMNDDEVAAVISYIRTSWNNNGTLVSPVEVRRFRGVPVD